MVLQISRLSRPVLSSVTFSDNTAARGGGLHNDAGSDARLSTVVFSANRARFSGGGIENVDSNPLIQSCVFSANLAGRGGAIYNASSHPTIVDCTFSANKGGRAEAVGSLNVLESGLWLALVVVSLSVILASSVRHRVLLAVLVFTPPAAGCYWMGASAADVNGRNWQRAVAAGLSATALSAGLFLVAGLFYQITPVSIFLVAALLLPWSFKWAWAPLVDLVRLERRTVPAVQRRQRQLRDQRLPWLGA